MKANELMIGDWVQIIYPDKYDGAKCTIRLIQDGDGCYYRVYIQDANYGYLSYGVFQDDIAPIPLTPEILEKNGFEKQGFPGWEIYTKDYKILWRNDYPNILTIESYTSEYGSFKKSHVDSVHELQHALRLCGIEKEIMI